MKRYLFVFISFFCISAHAAVVNSMLIDGSDYQLLSIFNSQHAGYVYAENNQHQKILIYKSHHPYPAQSVFSADQLEGTDILAVGFECYQPACTRYLNRKTDQLSEIYTDLLDYDDKKDIIAYYLRDKNLVVVSRAFKICKKPLTVIIELTRGYEFSSDTRFLPNGDLKLGYETATGKYIIKIIHVNFKKLSDDCRESVLTAE